MTNDDLIYHIEYPPKAMQESIPNEEKNEFALAYDESKLPVVILFAWAGCQDKHLAKYSSIYEDLGWITFRCKAKASALTYRLDKLPKVAKRVLEILHDRSLEEHPIFFHTFSNSGSYFYQLVSLEMQRQKKMFQVKGMIFDSAPSRRSMHNVFHTFRYMIGGPCWYNVPVSGLCALLMMSYFMILPFITALMEWEKPRSIKVNLFEEPYDWPQLFIYSKDDELNKCEEIEEFILHREKKGINVTRLRLENSPHVQHLITHREIYISTIVNFVKTCLIGNNKMQCRL